MICMDGGKIYREIKCPDCLAGLPGFEPYRCKTCNGKGVIRRFYKNLTEALEATEQEKTHVKTTGIDDLKPMKHDTLIIDDVEEDL